MRDRKMPTYGKSSSPRPGGKCGGRRSDLFRGSGLRITLIWVAWGVAVAALIWIVVSVYRTAGA